LKHQYKYSMKIRHNDIEPDIDNPFKNCKLGREKYALILTDIVENYQDGFVLAINGEWGTGKTTFVKMWKQHLENNGYRTLYFNAWETDFDENPLVALIAEFKVLTDLGDDEKFKSLIKKGAVFAKNIAPHLIHTLVEKYAVTKALAEAIEDATKGATEILEDEISEYTKKKNGITDFKCSLNDFIDSTGSEKPIVFIIDELDRCRPNYAVALLEQVKHLFAVPGIVFILSIDKEQLGNAIRGVYGSDRIKADEYLRRFIDLEYSLPNPETKVFVSYLYKYFEFDKKLFSKERKEIQEFWEDVDAFIDFATLLFDEKNLSLRQQEKIFAHARIALQSLRWNQYLFPTLLVFLAYLKDQYPFLYKKIHKKEFTTQELIDELFKIIPKAVGSDNYNYIIHLEALVAFMYDNYIQDRFVYKTLLTKDATSGKETVNVQSRTDKSPEQGKFESFIKSFYSKYDSRGINIKLILDKIDLLEKATL
jgi:hypothetical protein